MGDNEYNRTVILIKDADKDSLKLRGGAMTLKRRREGGSELHLVVGVVGRHN